MKILILCYGTRGDVQPYVALGQRLGERGHHVTVATSPRFREFVESHGLAYAFINDDLLAILDTDGGKDLLEQPGLWGIIRNSIRMVRKVAPIQRALIRESREAAEATDPDFILFSPKLAHAPLIAGQLDIPVALGALIPMHVPTGELRVLLAPGRMNRPWLNRASFALIGFITRRVLSGYIKPFRAELGLPPRRFEPLESASGAPLPVLHAISPAVVRRPADWPETAHLTGYWFLDEPAWQPPDALRTFLDAGPPPVYFGFGSMAGRSPEELAATVLEALGRTGQRGVIATGWGGLKPEALPDNVMLIREAPHAWLFPRMAATVHHGGAGTTAAALRAGRPTLIVPFFGDQPFWGAHIHRLGAAPSPIPRGRLTADRLEAALKEMAGNTAMQKKAAEIGAAIRAEDGTGSAATLIEELASTRKVT
ncbi:glycosyltransferase [Algicella marina]|uniref:Glycosyltransferase n=1 Tax=Algicella marina TaxID=2683284 RepID=A0A6P1T2G5_9RHOB|nr:glycosyltransferase [Algicella marina]QHQ35945.1 glycosyltransferase [Algicella marina]